MIVLGDDFAFPWQREFTMFQLIIFADKFLDTFLRISHFFRFTL